MKWLKFLWNLFFDAGIKWSQDNCQRFSAALSYYTVFSLAPLLVIIVAILGLVYEGDARIRLVSQVEEIAGAQISGVINTLIISASRPIQSALASFIALATFMIGASRVLVELRAALNIIWGFAQKEEETLTVWRQITQVILVRLFTLIMILAIGFSILAILIISTYYSVMNEWLAANTPQTIHISRLMDPLFTITTITAFFYLIMRFLPAHCPPKRNVLIGALVSAVLFYFGKSFMGFYLARAAATSVYGAASSLVMLMLWVYFSACIFLYGVQLAATLHLKMREKRKLKKIHSLTK